MIPRLLKPVCLIFATAALAFLPMGCKKAPPIKLACNASAPAVFPGDPLTVTATASSVNPKKNVNVLYSWTGDGVTGNGTTATVATGSLAPGSYTAKSEVKEGKKGKEGLKPGETAECEAGFQVKAFEPPTISCSASPNTIKPGDTSTVTSTAMSPQNRPLTYSYSTSSGSFSGTGATATYSSAGAPAGTINITCNVSDDKNHSASSDTNVMIVAPPPPPPPIPHAQALCSISFATDAKRPTRVDNEAKACLDSVALSLKQKADAKAVIVADSNAKEKATEAKEEKRAAHNKHVKVEDFAPQRAVNAKDYLVTDQGIDASRITVATGAGDDQSAQNYLVPSGATFANDVQGTTPVNETEVKPQVRKALPERHHGKKAANSK
jgi:hypothetical protein